MSDKLLPIGVFWDIENLNVPKYKSAYAVVQKIRDGFFSGYREAEFMCVCDINKENKDVIQELNSAQVNVVHIDATGKNAADDKIRQSLRRFSDTHPPQTRIILISGDFNFISDLSDLRHRKNYYTILIHGRFTNEALISCANESHLYDDLIEGLPFRTPSKGAEGKVEIEVRGFSKEASKNQIHTKLKILSNNCGGRVISVTPEYAILRFPSRESAVRAQKRMDGEKVFGFKITASFPGESENCTHVASFSDFKKPTTPRKFSSNKDFFEFSRKQDNENILDRNNSFSSRGASSIPIDIPHPGYRRTRQDSQSESEYSSVRNGLQETPENDSGQAIIGSKCSRNLLMIHQQLYQEQKQKEQSDMYNGYYRDTRPCSAPIRNSPCYVNPNISSSPRSFYRTSPSNHYPAYSPVPTNYSNYHNSYNGPNYLQNSSPNRFTANSFQPIRNGYMNGGSSFMNGSVSPCEYSNIEGPVELVVSNLDYNISAKEWRKILFTTFHPQVKVLSVHIKTQPDNTCIGMIKIPTIDEARFAISQFHRKKIGYKRIQVTLKHEDTQLAAVNLRAEIVSLLSEANGNMLPLFKFIELFDKRYHKSISVSELYKLRDIIDIQEHGGAGRYVSLIRNNVNTRPFTPDGSDAEIQEIFEHPVCSQHCPEGSVFYAEAMNCSMLPNVKLHIKPFSANVHTLLLSHNGSLPLMSFTACYAAEFSPLVAVKESGVPLEHLISCIPGIEIQISKVGMKKVQWSERSEIVVDSSSPDSTRSSSSPGLSQHLVQLSREIVDLLKHSSQCRMPVSKFIPAYHHHFRRQCRVADYGYNKLMELFEALPQSVQVLGMGGRKIITLSHRAQVRRFTADLLRILKWLTGKQMDLEDFPSCFMRVFGKPWDVTQYGSCYIEDLIAEVPASAATVYKEADRTYISIPRRDQAPEEIERTKQFALEVYDLLKHNQCRMVFNKFIPAYHHHFARQCKVAEYGFTKLSDLFEAISHVVEMEDEGEERILRLTLPEMRKVLSEQVTELLKTRPGQCIPLVELIPEFLNMFGFTPRYEDFHVECLKSLLSKLRHIIKVEVYNGEQYVVLLRHTQLPPLALQVLQLLMDQSSGSLPFVELCSWYRNTFDVDCDMKQIREELLDYVQVSGEDNSAVISLTPLQTLARDIRLLLIGHGKIPFDQLESAFLDAFGIEIKPALYGFPSLQALLYALPHIVTVRGRGHKKNLQLSKQLKVPSALSQAAQVLTGGKRLQTVDGRTDSDTPSNDSGVTDTHEEEYLMNTDDRVVSPLDLLCNGIPSNIPSPELRPASRGLPDLMSFTSSSPDRDYLVITDEERKILRTPLCQTPTSQILQFAAQYLPETKPGSPVPPRSRSTSPATYKIHKLASPVPILGQRSNKVENVSSSPVMRLLQGALSPRPPCQRSSSAGIEGQSSRSPTIDISNIRRMSLSPAQMKLWTSSGGQGPRSDSGDRSSTGDIQQGSIVTMDTLAVPEGTSDCEKSSEFGELLKGGWWKASPTQLEEVNKTFKLSSESWSGRSTPALGNSTSGRSTPALGNSTSGRSTPSFKNEKWETINNNNSVTTRKKSLSPAVKSLLATSLQNPAPRDSDELSNTLTSSIKHDADTTLDDRDSSFDTTLDSEMSYNLLFRRGHPLDTSSLRSDTPRTSPRKSRRSRLAAKFSVPLEPIRSPTNQS
ncbi:hypothetical protein SNE40_005480 [Patella caerulea]|uniref:HTH OST-type domain-containing protein n=1 Tax=Patella caerulea TaxID=87958 RepID=A0AAN8PXH5_PATCE